ncbi:hypothetical protein PMSD_27050 [Paenibacillus macquariensis subsp. defensor]|nr:hypothetical protein PMSD_27050 [Paenibacillus macquariensis subsp. defensor]
MNEIILYVAYDGESAVPIIAAIREANYEVIEVSNNKEAQEYAENHDIDMLILDQESDKMDYTLIGELHTGRKPIVTMVLSDQMKTEDIINGFNEGANEYITKPVQIEIVLVRIHNLFNLVSKKGHDKSLPITIGDLTIDLKSRRVMRNSLDIQLTRKEYDLLLYLARHVNEVCSREEILQQVWNYDFILGTNVVDVYIRHLRVKLDKGFQNKMIQTSRGVGYILEEPR